MSEALVSDGRTRWRGVMLPVSMFSAGAVAWLLFASIHIAVWPRGGPERIALFASTLILWVALGAAAVFTLIAWLITKRWPSARARVADVVSPLLTLWVLAIPYLPWLPDRFPLLLILAGPVKLVAVAAVLAVMASRVFQGVARPLLQRLPGSKTAFVVSLAVYLVLGMRSLTVVGLGGDEPHYLVITQSLLEDRDLRIENNHTRRGYRAFYPGELRPDYMVRGVDGQIYSIHAPGLSALLAPGYALAGARGAVALMCLLAAIAATGVFRIASVVASRPVAWATWAVLCLTVPLVPHAWAIYPEVAGAAVVAYGLLWLVDPTSHTVTRWIARGVALSVLPWLHTKFTVLLAGMLLGLAWQLRARLKEGVAVMAPVAISVAAWFSFFYVYYGSFNPQAPYGSYPDVFIKLENIPRSLIGSLFDQKFGLFVYAPVYLMAVVGAWALAKDRKWALLLGVSLLIATAYGLSSARLYMWWGGSSAPARFVVPLIPVAAPLVAAGFAATRRRTIGAIACPLAAVSLAVATFAMLRMDQLILFSDPHGTARLGEIVQGSAPLTGLLPTFTEPDWPAPLWKLLPWLAAAAACVGVTAFLTRRGALTGHALATLQALTLLIVASALTGTPSPNARADAVARGRLQLMQAYDPYRLRAVDYTTGSSLAPRDWLKAAAVSWERDPTAPADRIGRVTSALTLPPGRYEARVWFQGQRPRPGSLQLTLGRDQILARADGPLSNPALLPFHLVVKVPRFWLQLTDAASAQDVTRVEIAPTDVIAASMRPAIAVRGVDGVAGRPGAYLVYANVNAFPEGGVFWTRGVERASLIVVPAGARRMTLTLHVGPGGGTVTVWAAGETLSEQMQPDETREVAIDVPEGGFPFRLEIQTTASFRPSDVDARSDDVRLLGCQVRVTLE